MVKHITIFEPLEKVFEKENEIFDLFDKVDKVLAKRTELWNRYSRGITLQDTLAGTSNDIQILLEKFIVDIATGYLSGDIEYDVEVSSSIESKIKKKIFNITPVTADYADELRSILYTLASLNDDRKEEEELFRQVLLYGSVYERVMETTDNQLKYMCLDALNTVAVYNNDVDAKLEAVISKFITKENNVDIYYYRVYTKKDIQVYRVDSRKKVKDRLQKDDSESKKHNWGRVPVNCYESDFSILDRCQGLIESYENLLNNVYDTYQYNAEDCKMKIVGYRAQNPVMIPNPEYDPADPKKKDLPKMIINPLRVEEDNFILQGKTFYVEEGGDAGWMTKPVQANDVTTMLNYYIDGIFQMCGIPNTSDLAFNSGDLNASAIDRKFYIMSIALADIRAGVTSIIYDRLKMLLDRINMKHKSKYDIHNVIITIHTNLPSMEDENIDQMIRLDGLLSQETILERLGYDYETERARKLEEEDLYGINMEPTKPTNKETDGSTEGEEEGDLESNPDAPKDDKVRHPILQYKVKPDGRTSH